MEILEYLTVAYLVGNAYTAGLYDANGKVKWWRTLLLVWFAIPFFIGVLIWELVSNRLTYFGWYQDLRFWVQLNLTRYWGKLTPDEVYTYERAIENWETNSHSRVKKQWLRIKKKYNY